MKYASVCSGAEAWGPACHAMGYEPVFHAEIEKHASAVLRYQYPSIPNYGDFTEIATENGPQPTQPVRLLCGGTPCQTFSIAGLREGLDSYKGGLTLEFVKLAKRLGVQWILWENVPGVLSADGGRAFGSFLGALAECGYGFAYRVLDLQNWGVPQRRKRVFVVGYLGDWRPAAAVLFESESLRGDIKKGREKREGVTSALSARSGAGGGLGTDFDCAGGLVAEKAVRYGEHQQDTVHFPTGVMGTLPAGSNNNVGHYTQTLVSPDQQNKVWNVAFCDANGTRPDRPNGGMYVQELDTHKTLTAGLPSETLVQEARAVAAYGGGNCSGEIKTATCLTTGNQRLDFDTETFLLQQDRVIPTLCASGVGTQRTGNDRTEADFLVLQPAIAFTTEQTPKFNVEQALTLTKQSPTGGGQIQSVMQPDTATPFREVTDCLTAAYGTKWNGNASADNGSLFAAQNSAVRRLMPVECEKLMGWSPNWTKYGINAKGKQYELADGPRYRICGNGWGAPVVAWIAQRMKMVDELLHGAA